MGGSLIGYWVPTSPHPLAAKDYGLIDEILERIPDAQFALTMLTNVNGVFKLLP